MAIPKNMQDKYNEIAQLIDKFCDEMIHEKYNKDFKSVCHRLLEKLCRKRPSPLLGGRVHTWAAGIVYAIGAANFIFDKDQEYYMTSKELASGFGIAATTAGTKAGEIRKMFNINYFNHEWMLPKLKEKNPMLWFIQVNGLIVDARDMPLEIQEQAFEMGIIPYVPGEREKKEERDVVIISSSKEEKDTEKKPLKESEIDKNQGVLFE